MEHEGKLPIASRARMWKRHITNFGSQAPMERFTVELCDAYEQLLQDYAELEVLAEEIARQRDEARRAESSLADLRRSLLALGGAA